MSYIVSLCWDDESEMSESEVLEGIVKPLAEKLEVKLGLKFEPSTYYAGCYLKLEVPNLYDNFQLSNGSMSSYAWAINRAISILEEDCQVNAQITIGYGRSPIEWAAMLERRIDQLEKYLEFVDSACETLKNLRKKIPSRRLQVIRLQLERERRALQHGVVNVW